MNATTVPIVIASLPCANDQPANQYTAAGMIANVAWIDAITQRPAMR